MLVHLGIGSIDFVPLDPSGPQLFTFADFLTGLALLVLAWTTSDLLYRFRVGAAPARLQGGTFIFAALLGALTLGTDVWRANGWLVPSGHLLSPAGWQALLGGAFFTCVLWWAWFAFVQPPVFGKRNARRYAMSLYRVVLRGSGDELPVVADEVARSAHTLIQFATERDTLAGIPGPDGRPMPAPPEPPEVSRYANDLLRLIGDRRFCRAVVASAPGTIAAVFNEIGSTKKYGVPVEAFARNIVNAALANRESFLFRETSGYASGLIGKYKPISQVLFADFQMVELIGTMLDPELEEMWRWDASQWDAYCRSVLMVLRAHVKLGAVGHSFVLRRSLGNIEHATSDLYMLDGRVGFEWSDDIQARLRVVVNAVEEMVGILDEKGVPVGQSRRLRAGDVWSETYYDRVAAIIYTLMQDASAIRSPRDLAWSVQYNSIWGELFNFGRLDSPAGRLIKFKVRRLVYDEVARLSRFPNFKGSRILRYCLTVMGIKVRDTKADHDSRALHSAILAFMRKQFACVYAQQPRVAADCLPSDYNFDVAGSRVVRTIPAEGLRLEPEYEYLPVVPCLPSSGELTQGDGVRGVAV